MILYSKHFPHTNADKNTPTDRQTDKLTSKQAVFPAAAVDHNNACKQIKATEHFLTNLHVVNNSKFTELVNF